jgi:hypothetical protein
MQRKESAVAKKRDASYWVDVSAVAIALCAFVFTVMESKRNRDFHRRQSFPQMIATFYYTDEKAGFALASQGLGPANLKWFQVSVNGEPVSHWGEMFEKLGIEHGNRYHFLIPRIGWRSNKSLSWIVSINSEDPNYKLFKERVSAVELSGCYCSVYDECWIFRSGSTDRVSDCNDKPSVIFTSPPIVQ